MTSPEDDLRNLRLRRDSARYLAQLTPEQRRQTTAVARAELQAQLEREADPDGVLTPEELAYRVKHLRRAKMAEISMLGVEARRRKAQERAAAADAAELDALADAMADVAKAS